MVSRVLVLNNGKEGAEIDDTMVSYVQIFE